MLYEWYKEPFPSVLEHFYSRGAWFLFPEQAIEVNGGADPIRALDIRESLPQADAIQIAQKAFSDVVAGRRMNHRLLQIYLEFLVRVSLVKEAQEVMQSIENGEYGSLTFPIFGWPKAFLTVLQASKCM